MRKYEGKSNVSGEFIERILREKNMTKEDLCRKLQLNGINIDRWHLYKIINGKVILKDFELIIILNILDVDFNNLKDLIKK
ncbi:MAG: helix-turn-helix transcriptional regulator [Clostridia bacterium]